MRYRLRTLLIVLAILPLLLAVGWWKYAAWKAEQDRQRLYREAIEALHFPYPLTDIRESAELTIESSAALRNSDNSIRCRTLGNLGEQTIRRPLSAGFNRLPNVLALDYRSRTSRP